MTDHTQGSAESGRGRYGSRAASACSVVSARSAFSRSSATSSGCPISGLFTSSRANIAKSRASLSVMGANL